MESSKISKLDYILRKILIMEKKLNKIYDEIYLCRIEKMKTIKEDKEKEEYEEDCGKCEP